jgi:hypothetical protein
MKCKVVNTSALKELKRRYYSGFVPHNFGPCEQFRELTINGVTINLMQNNNCVCIDDNIGLVQNIISRGQESFLLYQKFLEVLDFFDYPLSSQKLGICSVAKLSKELFIADVKALKYKCVILPHGQRFVVIPLSHCI